MNTTLTRAHPCDLQIRGGGDGRTVCGLAMPFNRPTEITEFGQSYTEQFQRGAFTRTIAERGDRCKLLVLHDYRTLPLGRATLLREDAAGLYAEFKVSRTAAGDEALTLIRDGSLDGLSVGFRPVRDRWNRARDTVTRVEVKLLEISACTFPAYEAALITGVRQTTPPPPQLIRADTARRRLALTHLPEWM